jgi:hypothetical protein
MNFLHEFILHAVEIFLNTTNALDDAFDVDRKIVIAISSKKKKSKNVQCREYVSLCFTYSISLMFKNWFQVERAQASLGARRHRDYLWTSMAGCTLW